ncbi:hypothetical protein Tco_0627927 [Tanacetum coccineum]|uniref:Uncharacterized protein n=1 Tax=Tanacetum coccineum TaxID=301880 RepID=A0ABQ4WNX6_9ASTR
MGGAASYVSTVNGATPSSKTPPSGLLLYFYLFLLWFKMISSNVELDFSNVCLWGELSLDSIPNLQSKSSDEGFVNVKISYLGGVKCLMYEPKNFLAWNTSFESHKEKVYSSDDESVQEEELNENCFNLNKEEEGELNGNENDEVTKTIFMDNSSPSMNHSVRMDKQYYGQTL